MDETPDALRRTIAVKHEELNDNLAALETKAKELTDWRAQVDQRPLLMMGLAFGGGVVAAALLGGGRSRRREPQIHAAYGTPAGGISSSGDGTWHRLRGAIGTVAAGAALELLNQAAPGLKEHLIDPVREQMAGSATAPTKAAPRSTGMGMPGPASKSYNSPDAG